MNSGVSHRIVANTILGVSANATGDLSENLCRAIRAARFEMEPRWIEALRAMPSEVKLTNANALWLTARDQLYFQERRRGLDEHEAQLAAARRLLASGD
jgi:hypothetical protein